MKLNEKGGWSVDPAGGVKYQPDLCVQRRLCLVNLGHVCLSLYDKAVYAARLMEMERLMDTSIPPMYVRERSDV